MATSNQIIEGLKILALYNSHGLNAHLGGADHDIIYGIPTDTELSVEDAAKMSELGWHFKGDEGWQRFV